MTVKELRRALKMMPDNLNVVIVGNADLDEVLGVENVGGELVLLCSGHIEELFSNPSEDRGEENASEIQAKGDRS
jgi:hypothetical protein